MSPKRLLLTDTHFCLFSVSWFRRRCKALCPLRVTLPPHPFIFKTHLVTVSRWCAPELSCRFQCARPLVPSPEGPSVAPVALPLHAASSSAWFSGADGCGRTSLGLLPSGRRGVLAAETSVNLFCL